MPSLLVTNLIFFGAPARKLKLCPFLCNPACYHSAPYSDAFVQMHAHMLAYWFNSPFRPRRSTTYVDVAYCYGPSRVWSVCLSWSWAL